ncbi:MAG: M1 family peptidase [Bacteroidetes bacterium]|nr:M1 family peptidase [Bacteroidota bacterium]
MARYFPLFIISFVFTSCSNLKKTTQDPPIKRSLDTIVVKSNNPLDVYRAAEPRYWLIKNTNVALSFNLKSKEAYGIAQLKLSPYFYATDSLVLDAKSMEIDSVCQWVGKSKLPLPFQYRDDRLCIQFPHYLQQKDTVSVWIKYTAKPYAVVTGGSKAISDDRGLYFINSNHEVPGKPVQIWTQGETQSNSHWMPTIDHPNQRSTFRIELTVPDSFKTLSNGALIASNRVANNLRKDIWQIEKPIQVYAAMFAIGKFSVVVDEPWERIPVEYLVEPAYAPYAKKMFQHTPEMIDFFSSFTGVPFPWNKYSQVVVRDYVSGAMENTSASLFGEFMNQNFREIADKNYEDVVSHELFHQWFGDYVTAKSWSNLTLNESFATYGEQLWRKYKYGPAWCDELAFDDLAKYLGQTNNNDEPLVRFHYAGREDMFDRISYQKGGSILHYLHGLLGDKAFQASMKNYLSKNALQAAEASQWRLAIEEVTGLDWNWFFNQWYYRGGHPELDMSYRYDDSTQKIWVTVRQSVSDKGSMFQIPLKAALISGTKISVFDWIVSEKKQTFTFDYINGKRPLFIPDYEHWLVGIIREKKSTELWFRQLTESKDYINKRKAVSSAFLAQTDSVAQKIFHVALNDSFSGIRLHALQLLTRLDQKSVWVSAFSNDILRISTSSDESRIRAAAWDVIAQWKLKISPNSMASALVDSSYSVAGAALNALSKVDSTLAYQNAQKLAWQNPKSTLQKVVWQIIAKQGNGSDFSVFASSKNDISGRAKLDLAFSLYQYLVHLQDLIVFNQTLNLLSEMTEQESLKMSRFVIGSQIFEASEFFKQNLSAEKIGSKRVYFQSCIEALEAKKKLILSHESDPELLKQFKSL